MLLVLHNNLKSYTYNEVASGGVVASGDYHNIHNITSEGGAHIGGITVSVSEKSLLGFKCKDGAVYIRPQYVEAQANIKRRDYQGFRKSKALVAGITLCNQNLYPLFKTNQTKKVE